MKKTITLLSFVLTVFNIRAQSIVADFESFTLTPNSAYSPTTSTPFQTPNAKFQYNWDSQWSFWNGGFSYTNIHDSITAGFTNEYGVRAYKGFNNSSTFVVGLDESVITLKAPQNAVNGFYVTNTTYAYKTMASGDMFARKFGDTTGTGSGTIIAQGSYPDFFKLIVKGYKNGTLKNDSVTVFLANFTFTNNAQDFILDTWQFVNTSVLGVVDSIQFFMRSSDVGLYGINTPLYFAMDNFETSVPSTVGMAENTEIFDFESYPNPFSHSLTIRTTTLFTKIRVIDLKGNVVFEEALSDKISVLEFPSLQSGMYFLEMSKGHEKMIKKLIKN